MARRKTGTSSNPTPATSDETPLTGRARSLANLNRGGGKKGRSGRKPDAWKALCGRLVNDRAVIRAAKRILRNPDHPAYLGALKFFSAYKYGQPTQPVAVSGTLTLEELVASSREVPTDVDAS